MPIVGLTHEKDGRVRLHRTVTTKVAIGLPPDATSNYPKKLDHFVFLRQEMMQGKELKWVIDEKKQDHYSASCREFWIVLLDDNPDQCFRTEFAAWVKTRCWCRGDGERATRREKINGEFKGDFKLWDGPCSNNGCPDAEPQNGKPAACKPSADLYFMLQDFPELGTICRIHTSSYQSIRQIHSGLQDLCAVTGGRLMGVRCKLFVMPARNVFEQNGQEKTGTKHVLGLRLGAEDVPQLMTAMAETAQQFRGLQKQLAGRVLDIAEDEEERAPEIAAEFYGRGEVLPAADADAELRDKCRERLLARGGNRAQADAQIARYAGRLPELLAALDKEPACSPHGSPSTSAKSPQPASAARDGAASARSASNGASATTYATNATRPTGQMVSNHGLEVSDDDLPANMQPQPAPTNGQKPGGFDF